MENEFSDGQEVWVKGVIERRHDTGDIEGYLVMLHDEEEHQWFERAALAAARGDGSGRRETHPLAQLEREFLTVAQDLNGGQYKTLITHSLLPIAHRIVRAALAAAHPAQNVRYIWHATNDSREGSTGRVYTDPLMQRAYDEGFEHGAAHPAQAKERPDG